LGRWGNAGTTGNKKIEGMYGDESYDSRKNFSYLEKEEIEPVIKTRKNAFTKARGSSRERLQ